MLAGLGFVLRRLAAADHQQLHRRVRADDTPPGRGRSGLAQGPQCGIGEDEQHLPAAEVAERRARRRRARAGGSPALACPPRGRCGRSVLSASDRFPRGCRSSRARWARSPACQYRSRSPVAPTRGCTRSRRWRPTTDLRWSLGGSMHYCRRRSRCWPATTRRRGSTRAATRPRAPTATGCWRGGSVRRSSAAARCGGRTRATSGCWRRARRCCRARTTSLRSRRRRPRTGASLGRPGHMVDRRRRRVDVLDRGRCVHAAHDPRAGRGDAGGRRRPARTRGVRGPARGAAALPGRARPPLRMGSYFAGAGYGEPVLGGEAFAEVFARVRGDR